MQKDYTEFPDLANVYFEDSYVLEINEGTGWISFLLELVLTPEHPRYHPPLPDEQHCYADATLIFTDATEIRWIQRRNVISVDATGTTDQGNIDTMWYLNDRYELTGDWGEVHIYTSKLPRLNFRSQ